jgi:hypothetical protein
MEIGEKGIEEIYTIKQKIARIANPRYPRVSYEV